MANRKWAEAQLKHRKEELLRAICPTIREWLDTSGLKPELCELLGVSRCTLDRIIDKDERLTFDTLYMVAMALDLNVTMRVPPVKVVELLDRGPSAL